MYLKQYFEDNFKEWLKSDNRLVTYRQIKCVFGMEKYLYMVKNHEHKLALFRYRVSLHNLPIEKGRHLGIDRNKRICTLCNENKIGDEEHYFMYCKNENMVTCQDKFRIELYKYNKSIFQLNGSSLFLYLLACKDNDLVGATAIFVFKLLSIYRQLLTKGS